MDFFCSYMAPQAIERVTAVLCSGWVSEGKEVKRFEAALRDKLGLENPVAVNSGTAALHLALTIAGVGPGDEVILPAQTFAATGLVVLMRQATPVFADVDPTTGNISPESIAQKVTPRTKAVMPVHWGGYPCDLDEITAVAAENGLVVIEDAAHALGATYKGRPIGSISSLTAFSFQAIKHLTTGDGGVLCCTDPAHVREAVARRWFGIDRHNCRTSALGARDCNIQLPGYKYHMNDVAAAIGLGNLESFPRRLARRREIAAFYRATLRGVAGLELLRVEPNREHASWLFTILVDRREDFARRLADKGVPTSVVDLRIDRNSVFGGLRDDLPGQAEFDRRQISIPLHDRLSDEDVAKVVSTILAGW